MKTLSKLGILLIIFISYLSYQLFYFLDYFQPLKETGMTNCTQLNLLNSCIQAQIKYENYLILSTCSKCDCETKGSSFYSFDLITKEVKSILINFAIDKYFKGISLSVYDNNLFVVNEINNTVLIYEIDMNQQKLSLNYFYQIPVQSDYKLGSILAVHTYEMIATVQNLTSIYKGQNHYIKIFYDFLSYYGFYTQSFVLYMRNDIYEKRNDIKAVVGTEASMLSGITLDKQNRLFIGRPLEKAVGVYKYVGYKNWGVELILQNITNVNFPVDQIQYCRESNDLILTGKQKIFSEDKCQGAISRLQLSGQINNFQFVETLQTNKKVCGMSSAIYDGQNYYIASKISQQYLQCQK